MSQGIEVYEILENGNILNGIYTNSELLIADIYAIDNEIARKKIFDDNGVLGLYECRFIETIPDPTIASKCILEIEKKGGVYVFEWRETIEKTSKKYFKGLGLKAGNNHIAVTYSKA